MFQHKDYFKEVLATIYTVFSVKLQFFGRSLTAVNNMFYLFNKLPKADTQLYNLYKIM